ncbi:hypothetical protein C5167_034810 [Papaver somniferum]|uniref:Uncharacterized protein n=1 Tax=Papaver somniferum TaxID=3469 RepID=A0A4Y7KI79_PAPSO|nr:hypothetical protein C5167_034810 [Papaver somniferum]
MTFLLLLQVLRSSRNEALAEDNLHLKALGMANICSL